jgi:hypothetical protein
MHLLPGHASQPNKTVTHKLHLMLMAGKIAMVGLCATVHLSDGLAQGFITCQSPNGGMVDPQQSNRFTQLFGQANRQLMGQFSGRWFGSNTATQSSPSEFFYEFNPGGTVYAQMRACAPICDTTNYGGYWSATLMPDNSFSLAMVISGSGIQNLCSEDSLLIGDANTLLTRNGSVYLRRMSP